MENGDKSSKFEKKKIKKKLQSCRRNQYKAAKLHGKWRQIPKVSKKENKEKVAKLQSC